MSEQGKELLYLFDRPTEPVYVPKGENKVSFNVPREYLPEKYQRLADRILTRFGNDGLSTVNIKSIALPNLNPALKLGRQEQFSLFLPDHQKMAGFLIKIFMGMRTVDDLLSIAVYCRDRCNPELFIYALSVTMLHRPDTKHLNLPQLSEVFPEKYVDGKVFKRAHEEAMVLPDGSREPIEIPQNYTASDADPEHLLAYFREDLGVNLHHWHWHLIYPFSGPSEIVNKDRRGELFYYMHHQFMARYDTERAANGLPPTRRISNLREPIPEGYFPKLDSAVAGRSWPARPAGMVLSDVDRKPDAFKFELNDIDRFRDRILEAISSRSYTDTNGTKKPLTDENGIDVLGNMVEASILSPNYNYYGDIHNMGHTAIAYSHDPDHRYLESFGVMGDTSTAMRDPIFYRWHSFIDNIFMTFKDSLKPYDIDQLNFPDISVTDARISTPGQRPNVLRTNWTKSDIDLSRGLDFTPRSSIFARLTHLNHEAFTYSFTVINSGRQEKMGTVRIFLAPKTDRLGRSYNFNDQKNLMIEMDKFTTKLKPGNNTITRRSVDSAVTIPFESTFRDLNQGRPINNAKNVEAFNFCGCGWPQHLLVPKGNVNGFPMDLFVMVSNYDQDKVIQQDSGECRTGITFCGLRDRKYPDARPMGFPFDRKAQPHVNSLLEFLTPNMRINTVTIQFEDAVKAKQNIK